MMELHTKTAHPVNVVLADGRTYAGRRVLSIPLALGSHQEKLDLVTAPISYDIILGLPWLIRHNPDINWPKRQLTFTTNDKKLHILTQRPKTPTDDDDDAIRSAKQLERLLKQKGNRAYLCLIKDLDTFYTAVDQATEGQPDYLKKVLLDYDEVFQDVDSLPPS